MSRLILLLMFIALPVTGCKPHVDNASTPSKDEGNNSPSAEGGAHKSDSAHANEIVLTSEAIDQYGIRIETAKMTLLRPTFIVPARVGFNAEAMAHVGSPLAGRAVELKVRLGSDVKVGDPLVVVESPELGAAQSEFLIKRTCAQTAAPGVELANTSWERAQHLYESTQGIALTEVQKREAEHRSAVAALQSAEAEALAAENRLHLMGMTQTQVEALTKSGEVDPHITIKAPIAGQVVQREVTLGELVHPEREALLVLADMSTLWVVADVPEAEVDQVAVGAKALVRIGGMDAAPIPGSVAFIAPMLDAATRTAQVRVEVRGSVVALKPGMFARVEIETKGTSNKAEERVLAIPDEAVQTVEGRSAVFVPVAGEKNTFVKRVIRAGHVVGGMVPVLAGLKEGESVVVAGSFIMKAELGKGSAGHE